LERALVPDLTALEFQLALLVLLQQTLLIGGAEARLNARIGGQLGRGDVARAGRQQSVAITIQE
jgi:hypothetical protein